MPPVSQISNPTLFANWIGNPVLFDDGPTETRTVTYDDPSISNARVAWGKTSAGFYFFLRMRAGSEEAQFWAEHANWVTANPGTHSTQVFTTKPPSCGTPNTPPCP